MCLYTPCSAAAFCQLQAGGISWQIAGGTPGCNEPPIPRYQDN